MYLRSISHLMPEFDTITIAVLAVAIVGIIIVTAKSRLNSNNSNYGCWW